MKKALYIVISAAILAGSAGAAFASDDRLCGKTPDSEWMSKDEVKAKAAEMGYDVRKIKVEDGCYEVYAKDAQGKKVELFMHPVSAEVVKTEVED
ncbi:MAG: PepSY domain-containing protein [Gammaproteobacteria bacterium]|nr:PepSY domain-containing protein [Gammaproteobacteria bacterium]